MSIKQFFILLFILLSTITKAQNRDYVNEMEQNDLRIRQKPNTEKLLSDYLH